MYIHTLALTQVLISCDIHVIIYLYLYTIENVITNGIEQVPTTSLTGSEENNTNTGQENQVPKTGLTEEDTSKEVTKKETIVAPPPPLSSPPPDFDPFNIPYEVRDKVKERFKGYFGGREKVLAVGGAAVPAELKKFLSFCFDGLVQEGYGTTEVRSVTINSNICMMS